jgi:general secretion pathway protein A
VNNRLQAQYGLKWHPFSCQVPVEALLRTAAMESFCYRVKQQRIDGGFSMISGPPGSGKSATLRVLEAELMEMRDVRVGVLSRPQASVPDCYRELGDVFSAPLRPHNRWNSAKVLRECWQAYINASSFRPVLLIDEAQDAKPQLLQELRLLSSSRLDSNLLLTVVLAGDQRLPERLRCDELAPLASRIRVKLALDRLTEEQLQECLTHAIECAGAPRLMTPDLINTLCIHAQGNLRALMNLAAELLDLASQQDKQQLDEKLFFEAFPVPVAQSKAGGRRR